ncbi:MAG TPA: PAS domain S-box protein [Flavobacteriales bacterium]
MSAKTRNDGAYGPMLSLTEAAALLKCHHNTVRAWVRQGRLEAVPMGPEQVAMFRKEDVEALRKPLEQAGVIVRDDKHAFPVVGIGASAGGLDAIARVLLHLPTDLGLAYVIVQHLETDREAVLADLLRKKTTMPVFVIENGMRLDPDRVYVAPANTHAAVINGTFTLRVPHDATRPIDAFFTALATEYQNNAIGIVLSGTGSDGTDGLRAIRAEEGLTMTQDASALEQGMPRSAQDAEVVDLVVKPEQVGKELAELVKQLYAGGQARIPSKYENELRRILNFLHTERGIDFTQYKEATIHRRIIRRMVLSKCRKLSEYSALLHGLPSEVDTLCGDMLINVTSFFRDPLFYKALDQQVFPALLKDRPMNDPLRIWIAACAGGEEVVSVAIALLEHIGDRALTVPVQIFATDLNERTIEKARLGIYKKSALQNLPAEHLKKYFQHVDGHFQVIKAIRDMCVFAKHDLLKDPPFSRVDLVSCQNMLIYLENHAQERVVRSFHYALKSNGFLALGKSESASVAEGLFDQPDRTFKIYTKKQSAGERVKLDVRFKPTLFHPPMVEHGPLPATRLNNMADLDRDTERLLLNRYVPASVLIDKRMEIIRFRGTMTPYLAPTTGRASLNLLKMVRDDLSFELRGLLQRVKKEKAPVRKGGIAIRLDDLHKHIALEVVPIGDIREPHYLVLFTEEMRKSVQEPPDGRKWKNLRDERERRIIQLEQELAEAREQMRIAAEEAENGQQELQAANEEVVSSNEELQSINEELETSKEELQSINEEFATINEELQARNESLLQSEERYRKLIDLMPVAVYTCDANGHLRLFNEAAVRLWGRSPVVGGTLWCGSAGMRTPEGQDLATDRSPMAVAVKEERVLSDVELILQRHGGEQRAVLANATPLYDGHGKVNGAISVLTDITDRKQAEDLLRQSEERFKAIYQHASFGIVLSDTEGRMVDVNPAYAGMVGYSREDLVGRTSVEIGITIDKGARQRTIAGILDRGSARNVEMQLRRKDGSTLHVRSNADTVMMGNERFIISMVEDITARKQAEEAKRLLASIVESSEDAILTRDLDGVITSWNKAAERIFGYTAEEIVGKPNHLLYPPDSKAEEERLLDHVRRGVRVDHFETVRLHKDRTPVQVALTLSPLKNDQGAIIGASKVIRDITDSNRVREAIRTSEERFHLMADNVVQLIWMAEADGSGMWFNRPWFEFTGLTPEQIRMDAKSLHHPDHYERVTASLRSSAEKGERWEDQFPLKSKEGKYHWFMATAMPVRDDSGKVARWFGTLTDITADREAKEHIQQNEERFRMLADNMSQMAYVADAAGNITWVNRRWLEFTGLDVAEMNDGGWGRVVDPAHLEGMVRSYREAQERGDSWEHVFRLRSTEGEYRWFLSRSVPIKDSEGKVERWFGTNTDITAQKLAEEALEESATHKDHFLATLAHELRNPLAPLKNGLQLMELVPDDPRTMETTRAMMVRQLDHMVRLVDDLMDLSRISRGKIELVVESVDLQAVVATAIESNKPFIERKGHELEVDLIHGPLIVNGDMARLTQVVANLLNNAAKYTPNGGHIGLKLERRGKEAVIRVKDDGIGIEPSAIPHVFDMFAQIDGSQQGKESGGLGIGLNIVQRLMAMHNGSIEGISQGPGKGSEFVVTIPLAEASERVSSPSAPAPAFAAPRTRRVLVVDDNEDAAFSMSIILKKNGHTVMTAHDGLQAVELAATFRPEVVLMDIGMPRMNGLEACKAIRETAWGKDMYLIALSGWGQEEDRRKSEQAGFDQHIVKPIEPRTLERVIQEADS